MISIAGATIVARKTRDLTWNVYISFPGTRTFLRPCATEREAEELACRTALSHPSFTDILNDGDWLSV